MAEEKQEKKMHHDVEQDDKVTQTTASQTFKLEYCIDFQLFTADILVQAYGHRQLSGYHTLTRTWATGDNPAVKDVPGHEDDRHVPPSLSQWLRQSMHDSPYDNIGAVGQASAPKGEHEVRGETGSNSAAAGSVRPESDKTSK
ncbi:MAG: hypothetical protein L6R38_004371 [Xanthoria sp. 2 TBL-2021]|nr:MAG: hypothetical protein L6R38_004371 [Xanthoria sp. 2 TBL-2021]